MVEIDAIRVAAIGNNAPVSYGALGAPIIALAAVTNVPLLYLSASVGRIVAILALLPPWILIYLVSGRRGLRGIWPLPVVGSLAYVLGQFPTSQWLGPYLPDIIGALVSFGALLLLLRFWRPAETLGYGGVPVSTEAVPAGAVAAAPGCGPGAGGTGTGRGSRGGDQAAAVARGRAGRCAGTRGQAQPGTGPQSGGTLREAVPGLSRSAS